MAKAQIMWACSHAVDRMGRYLNYRDTCYIGRTISKTQMILVSSYNCLCPLHWSHVLSRKWRCSRSKSAPTTSDWSTNLLPTNVCLILEVWWVKADLCGGSFRLRENPTEKFPTAMPSAGHMMTSSNGNIFRVPGHLCGEFTGPRWILNRPFFNENLLILNKFDWEFVSKGRIDKYQLYWMSIYH